MFFCWRWWCVCVFGHKCNGLHADFYERDGRKCERGWRRRRKKGKSHIRESRWSWWRLPCLFVFAEYSGVTRRPAVSVRLFCHNASRLPSANTLHLCSLSPFGGRSKTFPSYYLSLKMFHSLPLLPSCRKPCPNATGHNPAGLLLTPAWPFVG